MLLPQRSLATHFWPSVYSAAHRPAVIVSLKAICGAGSHGSVARTTDVFTVPISSHDRLALGSALTMVGAVVSCTQISCDRLNALPQLSVAVHRRTSV